MPKTQLHHILRGGFNLTLMLLNVALLPPLLLASALVRQLPIAPLQRLCQRFGVWVAQSWISNNTLLLKTTLPTQVIADLPPLSMTQSYLVASNHQSWVDILVLQALFNKKAPFFRFFLKQELIWVPIMGLCWWALDYPFMRRYSKEKLLKNPELKGRDKEETIQRMLKFKDLPVSIMVFLEGTRFTQAKHDQQKSPYVHLSKPKSAGAAYALSVLSDKLDVLINTTIVYPHGVPTFTEYLMGKCPQIKVKVTTHPIPLDLRRGDYEQDVDFKARFQQWVNDLWHDKDQDMAQMLSTHSK